jgi:hypothetical protein
LAGLPIATEHAVESRITVNTGQSLVLCVCPDILLLQLFLVAHHSGAKKVQDVIDRICNGKTAASRK